MDTTLALLCALLGGMVWAIVIGLDRFTVTDVFRHPLQALVLTGVLGIWGFALLPFFDSGLPHSAPAGWTAFIAGTCLALSLLCYFLAMKISSEAAEVAAWDAAHPLLIALLSIPLGLHLSPQHWVGMLLVIGSIVAFEYHKGLADGIKVTSPFRARCLLFLNALFMALTYLLMGLAIRMEEDFWTAPASAYWHVYPLYLAGVCTSALAVLHAPVWRAFKETFRQLVRLSGLLFVMEVCNVVAPLLITFAMLHAHPAVASALGATFPIWLIAFYPLWRFLGASEVAFPPLQPGEVRVKFLIFVVLVFCIGLLHGSAAVEW